MTASAESLADRLDWLFDVVVARDPETGTWRRYTDAEVQRVLPGPTTLERLRAGASPDPGQLAALAAFFEVDIAFFGDDPAVVDQIRDELLVSALRACGVLSYLICRMSVPIATQREQLRHALSRERAAMRAPETWHDDQRVEEPGHDSGTTGMTATPMSMAQLHTLCRNLVEDLGLNAPFGPHELCERLAAHRGRRIKVRATDLGATSGVGHLAPTRDMDRIFVEKNSPAPQQTLVIFHEVMHIVRDHLQIGDTFSCGVGSAEDLVTSAYGDWREWEAEVGARELARLAQERPRPNRLPPAAGSAEQSIAAAFGFTHGR
ncbi:ImmA/IrrE family metallo-endopeptidase [Kibdelosporangium persicum]|uniref:ImmA/IrrE family metallo-endopeptidase n=1 Tax=Kibdelosporangium persicum TaxID=2698649 RepID=A0ABX2F825_9PSEU|nr:ImmA/IrrE family metallo-endopeptidase [Kibdelosporangium persicum]NRN66945.1 ImmA/IrrE family metallo-endopeptidase [Kibdelosporangium persicum]